MDTPSILFNFGPLILLLAILKVVEQTSYMRGQKKTGYSDSIQKLGRLCFFACFFFPLISYQPLISILLLPYLPTYADLSEINGGRPNKWVRDLSIWKKAKGYWGLSLKKTVDLDPKGQYLFACHPHGILPLGAMINLITNVSGFDDLFPDLQRRGLAASMAFYIPLYRDLLLSGGICDAGKYSAEKILKNGYSLILVPGGASEALFSNPNKDELVLRNRQGFIRLALQHGLSLVPVFSFNECATWEQFSPENKWIHALKTQYQRIFGISLPLIKNLLPKPSTITTVVGPPIPVPKIQNPTDEEIAMYLDSYIVALTQLWNDNRHFNRPPNKELIIR